ncbi:MAG TPA: GNAT family N-acetyltransferase [Verrucomicrobiae bacterium]|jgi:CelD/BcsL family acetyltransferase involved in cellulose biosynthesis|nr:GNAT family N-acetyltransferase [Verrucomicrobiae bacterium]
MVVKIETAEDFEQLRGAWRDLLDASSANCFFLTWEWLFTWWKHLSGQRKLFILTLHSGGKMIALAPFAAKPERFGIPPTLEFLGSGAAGSDYLDLIVRNGSEREAIDELAEYLAERKLLLDLGQLRSSALARRLARTLGERSGYRSWEVPTDICPYIELTGATWDSYLASLGASHRANFQRRLKQLRRDFTFRFESAATEEQRRDFLAALIDLHRRRWRDKGRSEAFSTPDMVSFHDELSQRALERGWLRLFILSLDDLPAAALYGFHHHGRFYFFQSGLDPDYARYSTGLVAMGLTIRFALEEGAQEYDLLHGSETYKFLWARSTREIHKLEVYPPSAAGFLYGHISQAGRVARRLGWTILPKPLAEKIATARRTAQLKGYYAAQSR